MGAANPNRVGFLARLQAPQPQEAQGASSVGAQQHLQPQEASSAVVQQQQRPLEVDYLVGVL